MERKIGDEFEIKLRIKAIKSDSPCIDCMFYDSAACEELKELGNCGADTRTDGKYIHFKIVPHYSV